MIRMLLIAATAIGGISVAAAQGNPIESRKALLKTFGAATRDPGQMLRGEAPFDLAKVQASLKVFAEGSPKLPAMFPAGSGAGDTKALPVIWTEQDKFNAIFTKLAADSTAAMTSIKDEASFKTEMPKVLGNCGACHNAYRAK